MNVLYLDNDECLGYFGLISGLFSDTVCDYCMKLKLLENNDDRINAEALFLLFAAEMLDMGSARPGLKDFFKQMKKLKKKGYLDKIIMYTSAERYSNTEKNYVNWVSFMKNLFEFYTYNTFDNKDLFLIYDLDHSGRSDEIPRESADGATLKSVEVPLKRLGLSINDVKKIAFLDDRPQNIFIDGDKDKEKLKRIGMLPYYYLPKKEDLKKLCEKYDDDFIKLGMKSLSSILDKQYESELDEFRENKYPIGIPHFDMTELDENKEDKRNETPPPSIDITNVNHDSSINIPITKSDTPIDFSNIMSFQKRDADIESINISGEQIPRKISNTSNDSIDISGEQFQPRKSNPVSVSDNINSDNKSIDISSIDISGEQFQPRKSNSVSVSDNINSDIQSIDISMEQLPKKIIQIGDASDDSDNLSIDLTKMIEKSASRTGRNTESMGVSSYRSEIPIQKEQFTIINPTQSFKMGQAGITDFNLSKDEIDSIIPSINISNISDHNERDSIQKPNISNSNLYNDLKKKEEKIKFKDFSEEFGSKKETSIVNNIITDFNKSHLLNGGAAIKRNVNIVQETLLNDITPLTINQNVNNQSNFINKSLSKAHVNDNTSIDITNMFNERHQNTNNELPDIDLNNFSLNYD